MTDEMDELEPCPFCGGEASENGTVQYGTSHEFFWEDGTQVLFAYYVNCMCCLCSNKGAFGHQTKEQAIEHWNTRSTPYCAKTAAIWGE